MMLKPGTPSAPPQDDVHHTSPQDNPDIAPPQKPPTKPELAKPKPTAASHITHLRAGQEARFKENYPATFKVLATHVDRARTDIWSLSVTVRATGESAGTWLGSDNFRLLVDDVPQAPTNLLGEAWLPIAQKKAPSSSPFRSQPNASCSNSARERGCSSFR
ncbi:MAG: hypothetical protein ABI955_05790 [Nitrospirota bacterium]